MKKYNTPDLRYLNIDAKDIIQTSGFGGLIPDDEFDTSEGGGMIID